jgi:hypothetical protein
LPGDWAGSVGVTAAVDEEVDGRTVETAVGSVVGSDEEQAASVNNKSAMPINQNALFRKNVGNWAPCDINRTLWF